MEPLPSLFESDDAVRDALAAIPLGTAGQQYLMPSSIIERSASLIYLTAQGDVALQIGPNCQTQGRVSLLSTMALRWWRIQRGSRAMTPSRAG